jgi:hypothetical protein
MVTIVENRMVLMVRNRRVLDRLRVGRLERVLKTKNAALLTPPGVYVRIMHHS